ncbi:MAG: dihydroorotate dehydrogenase electron transfer subunit [Thermoflexaceae bacterium]|nr:dihydroorotate dehydrogenase electron transfer subunit [Thermoflexaceae bacterium]
MEFREKVRIVRQEQLSLDVYSLWIETKDIAVNAKPGQFVSVYSNDGSRLLPRPISICETDGNNLRMVYRVVGKGTEEFSGYKAGDTLDVLGPLGNGYTLDTRKAILLGGGIGIPPMLELAKRLNCQKSIVLGYRDVLFLNEEFEPFGDVYIATEDGSAGTRGNVLDAIREQGITGEVIYACGPKPMLRAIKAFAEENGMEAFISLEEKMACGIGACLACVCKTKDVDSHSHVHNARICKEGPVFNAKEVEF